MKRLLKLGSKGDTIIEVLLSIAVMSLVLSISFGLANRSSKSNQQAQERAEAQKVTEEQLELLRGYVSPTQDWGVHICFKPDSTPSDVSSDCQLRGPGSRYNTSITYDSATNTFVAHTTWNNIKGGTDQLTLNYRLPSTGDIAQSPHYACSDGIDNDGDGLTDYGGSPSNDPDCTSPTGTSESTLPPVYLCSDGVDNDGDGLIDLVDPGCQGNPLRNSEVGSPVQAIVNPSSQNFASWHLYNTGGARTNRTFTFTNSSGDAPLQLTTAAIGGPSSSSFSIVSNQCSNISLAKGSSCNITVQFYPLSGGTNNRLSNAGLKQAVLTLNNSSGVAATTANLSGSAFSDQAGPGDVVTDTTQVYFRTYNPGCYNNVEACGSPLTGIQGNGNLSLGNTYCLWGGWGPSGYGTYPFGENRNRLVMQTDGNLVFYDPHGYRYASWTHNAPGLWLRIQDQGGGVFLAGSSGGPPHKWIHWNGSCFAW